MSEDLNKVKVLTIREPWLQAILTGRKTIEIRTWKPNYRGLLYLHSSSSPDKEAYDYLGIGPEECVNGYIRARCYLLGCIDYTQQSFEHDYTKHWNPIESFDGRQKGLILEQVQHVRPYKTKGQLGVWEGEYPTLSQLV